MMLCRGCRELLPLAGGDPDETASWACAACGTVHRAVIDSYSTEAQRRSVRIVQRGDRAMTGRVRKLPKHTARYYPGAS
jgi:hypothetical protein